MIPTVPTEPLLVSSSAPSPGPARNEEALRAAARALEATFLAEMLKSAGLGAPGKAFGGGAGEDQFASFQVRAQAERMVAAGGIGLAERLFEALQERTDGTS